MPLHTKAYTIAAAAELLGVEPQTLHRWIQKGHLKPIPNRRGLQGQRYYTEKDLYQAEYLNRRGRTHRRVRPSA